MVTQVVRSRRNYGVDVSFELLVDVDVAVCVVDVVDCALVEDVSVVVSVDAVVWVDVSVCVDGSDVLVVVSDVAV